jgi:hypothetical protein
MVRKVALQLEIDARQMQQGAQEANRALDVVGQKAAKVGQDVDRQAKAVEREIDTIVDGVKAEQKALDETGRKATDSLVKTERALVGASKQTANFREEMNKTGGIMGAVEEKFRGLGKAAVGIFAADVVAKVFGFTSAMDVLQKASNAVATSIKSIGVELLGLKNIQDQEQVLESLTEQMRKLEEMRKAQFLTVATAGGAVELARPDLGGNIELQMEMLKLVMQAQQRIANIEAGLTPGQNGFAIFGNRRAMQAGGLPPQLPQEAVESQYTVQGVLAELRDSLRYLADEASLAARGTTRAAEALNGISVAAQGGQMFPVQAFEMRPFVGDMERAREQQRIERARLLQESRRGGMGINAGYTAQTMGFGGIPEPIFQQPTGVQGIGMDYFLPPPSGVPRLAARPLEQPSALEQRYSVDNIAQDFTSQFYGAMKNSLMTGDFSDFGRQVTTMIGSSLIDALIAAPFQEAMNALVSALLAGIRGAMGGPAAAAAAAGAAAPADSGQSAPAGMRASTASTSNAGYRSQRQAADDYNRRRIV